MKHIGKKRGPGVALCGCQCHSHCALARRSFVPQADWESLCSCAGTDLLRSVLQQTEAEHEERRRRTAEVFHDVDVGRGRSAGEIQQQILAAYAAHGYEPPSDHSRLSRFIAASTGRRGTRTIRLLVEALRGLRAARKWTPPAPDEADGARRRFRRHQESEESIEARNKRELRGAFRALAVCAILAVGAALGAYFASGIFQVILIVLAILLSAIAAWGGLWTLVASILVGIDRRSSHHR